MSWNNTSLICQTDVINTLRQLAKENLAGIEYTNAYLDAATELELWSKDREIDPFDTWMKGHQEDLKPYAGRAVAVHLDKGIVADAGEETFWDGTLRDSVAILFNNDPNIRITVVPNKLKGTTNSLWEGSFRKELKQVEDRLFAEIIEESE